MANQHTLTLPIREATEQQLLVFIATRLENHMAEMTAAIERLRVSLTKEISDIRDGLQAQVDGLGVENAGLRDQLGEHVAKLDAAVGAVNAFADELDANDAPVDPAPVDPTDHTDPTDPVDPDPEGGGGVDGTPTDPPVPAP